MTKKTYPSPFLPKYAKDNWIDWVIGVICILLYLNKQNKITLYQSQLIRQIHDFIRGRISYLPPYVKNEFSKRGIFDYLQRSKKAAGKKGPKYWKSGPLGEFSNAACLVLNKMKFDWGLIDWERKLDEKNRLRKCLFLTPKGEELADAIIYP